MHKMRLWIFAVLLLTGCEKTKKPDEASAPKADPKPATPAPETVRPTPQAPPAPPAPTAPTAPPPAPAPAAPKFDVEALRARTYAGASGARLSFTRDKRVELVKSGGEVVRGTGATADGDRVVFTVLGSGTSLAFKVDEKLEKLVGGEPEETFTALEALTVDGKTYASDTGLTLTFNGTKATYAKAGDKATWTGTDVKYTDARITVTEKHGKDTIARMYSIENGGYRLIDVTPAQVAATFLLQEKQP